MWPDRVSNPGPLTYESGALSTGLCGPAGGGVGVGLESGGWRGREKQKCKITNMSHHRIHVSNIILFVTIYISKQKDHK